MYDEHERNDGTDGGGPSRRRLIADGGTMAAQSGGRGNVTSAKELFGEGGGGNDIGFDYLMSNAEQRGEFIVNESALEYEEWKTLSDAVIETRDQQLNLISDLRGAGLTEPENLASLVSRWQTIGSISEEANIGLGIGEPKSDEESPGYGMDGVPLPVMYKDWRIDRRFLMASRQGPGGALDTTVARQITRALSNTAENAMLNGWMRPVDNYEMYGFLNHPDRNQVTGNSWHNDSGDASGSDGDSGDIRHDLLNGVEALENDEYDGGGYWLYINRTQNQRLRRLLDDFGTGNPGRTNMRDRINEEFEVEIDQLRVTKNIPDGEALMFAPSPDVVQMGVAEDFQPLEWESPSGGTIFMRVLGAMNLKLKSTQEGQMGVAHITGLNP